MLVYLGSALCQHTMFIILALFVFVYLGSTQDMEKQHKIVIDNDAGGDDAMAIFLALLYEKHYNGPKLVALTTGNGNAGEDKVYTNNQRILKVAKRQDVPIYRGSKSSLVTTPEVGFYFGHDGLGDVEEELTDLVPAQTENAVNALVKLSEIHKDELSVITIGTLTNVALALKLDPGFIDRIGHLYVGAGLIHDAENPDPEFNAHMDVEAYHVIVQIATPDKVTFFPFSQVKKHLNFSREWRESVLGAIDTDIMRHQNLYEQVSLKVSDRWQALDPAVVAAVIKQDLVNDYKYSKHGIMLCGDQRGINTNAFVNKEDANARIIYSMKHQEYKQFLLDVFSADIEDTHTTSEKY